MKKTWIRLVSLIIVTLLLMAGLAVAEETKSAEVVFSAVEKENDIVQLDVIVKNATFKIFQTAIRYDGAVVMPVDETGKKTIDFDSFSIRHDDIDGIGEAGCSLESEKTLFGFTLFVKPGSKGRNINRDGEVEANDDGLNLFSFSFKRLKEGSPAFEIAFEDDKKAYQPALKEGIIVLSDSKQLDTKVSYIYEGKEPKQVVVKPVIPEKEPIFTSSERKKDVICLQIGKAMTVSMGKKTLIDANNRQVVPYITNDRTMVPARFVAETLGAEVLWEEGWEYCIVKKDDKEIKLNFNSAEFEVNGEKVNFDAPVEITQDRTMVPLRFVSEQLDCDVYWSERNQAVVISPTDNPWQEKRDAEITALNEMLVTITGLLP